MACNFSYLENECGCLIGYTLPLKTQGDEDVTAYPVNVINVNGEGIGEAANPSAVVSLWNADAANQAKGVLSIGNSPYCFTLSYVRGVVPPSKIVASFEEPEPPVQLQFGYAALDLDTTGERPSEQDYLDAADAATLTTKNFSTGSSVIQVDAFGNVSDKVLYVEVPESEPAFTKWSVKGDPLQQNQPIDNGYGIFVNVIFRIGNQYFTKDQTTFTGALILSR